MEKMSNQKILFKSSEILNAVIEIKSFSKTNSVFHMSYSHLENDENKEFSIFEKLNFQ